MEVSSSRLDLAFLEKLLWKYKFVHMRIERARLGEISLDFAEIPPRRDENFPYEHAQVGQPGKVGYHFL